MLYYQPAVVLENLLTEDEVGQGRQLFQGIWRVCKNQVVPGAASRYILEYIAANDAQIADAELLAARNNPILLHMGYLYRRHFACSTADALDAYATGAGKEVQHIDSLKVQPIVQ